MTDFFDTSCDAGAAGSMTSTWTWSGSSSGHRESSVDELQDTQLVIKEETSGKLVSPALENRVTKD